MIEYSFTKKYRYVYNRLFNIICLFLILKPMPFTAKNIIGIIYEMVISFVLLISLFNQIYIICTKRFRQPNIVIDDDQITILKWFLGKGFLYRNLSYTCSIIAASGDYRARIT